VDFGTRGIVLNKSRDVMIVLEAVVCLMWEEKLMDVSTRRRDIYTQVPVIVWFKLKLLHFDG